MRILLEEGILPEDSRRVAAKLLTPVETLQALLGFSIALLGAASLDGLSHIPLW